jgi:hypothetical protein
MMKFDFLLKVDALPPAEKREANRFLSAVQLAILRVQTEQLANLRNALVENEEDIEAAVSSVEDAVGDVKKVAKAIEAAGAVLKVVGRILPVV